jgi:exopolysaccharide biosynthesis polyprenyl glycosylphosphotransferase
LLAKDYILRLRASHLATHGKLSEPVLLAGVPVDMERLVASFTTAQKLQINVVGRIDISTQPLSALVDALHEHSVTRVIFAAAHGQLERVQAAIEACETEGVEAWMMADFIRTAIARPTFDMLGERPMLVFRTTSDASWELLAKRLLDIFGAFVGLILLSPVLLALAILIKLSSRGPVLFRQLRGGLHGRPFTMLKFRSMVIDAEQRKTSLVELNKMEGPVFKVDGDPRVTRFGHWLRKTSLDELPQLYNVLRGDMSLVGPRPLPLDEIARIEIRAQRRRLSVPPGLTCLWQISGRNEITSFDEWVRLDLAYIDSWSLWLDFKILLRTVPVVFTGLGAR